MKTCGEWPWEHRICTDCRQAAGIYFSPQYCANTCILPGCASAASLQRGFQSAYIGWLKAFSDNQVACAAGFYGKLVVSQAENQRLQEAVQHGIDACCTHPACLEDDGCPLRKALKGDGS